LSDRFFSTARNSVRLRKKVEGKRQRLASEGPHSFKINSHQPRNLPSCRIVFFQLSFIFFGSRPVLRLLPALRWKNNESPCFLSLALPDLNRRPIWFLRAIVTTNSSIFLESPTNTKGTMMDLPSSPSTNITSSQTFNVTLA
jgi:hypothetical protein